jgi:hypothetical protein
MLSKPITRRPRTRKVVRHKGEIKAGTLTLQRGAYVREIDKQGDMLSDAHDPRFLCRLELGDGAIVCDNVGAFFCVRVTRVHDTWAGKYDVDGGRDGAVIVLPATGLR